MISDFNKVLTVDKEKVEQKFGNFYNFLHSCKMESLKDPSRSSKVVTLKDLSRRSYRLDLGHSTNVIEIDGLLTFIHSIVTYRC